MIKLFNTYISNESKRLVNEVLDSGYLNQGPMVRRFETTLEEYGLINPLTTSSCTAALHIALECCDVRGKEVILPAQSFVATGLAVLMAGGTPVFTDIGWDGNIFLPEIEENINSRTAAIVCVHWGGNPCDIISINKLASEYGIPVIEDAAHALGASIDGEKIGSISDFTCFSFQSIKMVSCGDGGCICVKDDKCVEDIERMKWFGMNRRNLNRKYDGTRDVNINRLGYKYHMNDLSAAIGLGNLTSLDERISKRLKISRTYDTILINTLNSDISKKSSHWLYSLLVRDKKDFIDFMSYRDIECSSVDTRIDSHRVFGSKTRRLRLQEEFDKHHVCIPCHEELTEEEITHIKLSLQDYFSENSLFINKTVIW